jgi:1-acyl-sn-glycerol-3-phosphate acyltransferase
MLTAPAPYMAMRDRMLFRPIAAIAARQVVSVTGFEHITPDRDPFILAPNHSSFLESILMPTLLVMRRQGKFIHFLADWSFRLIPVVGLIYRRGQVVNVTSKDAKPDFLNAFRRFYESPVPPMEQARAHLMAGRPIGIFPEGAVNKDRRKLQIGRVGMARLSLETGVPIVPVGIRFPTCDLDGPIREYAPMTIAIGAAMTPPEVSGLPTAGEVRRWHGAVMHEIGRLSGKTWGR